VTASAPIAALREWCTHARQPVVLAALAGVALVLGAYGPFDTLTTLPTLPRLGYWVGAVGVSYAAAYYLACLTAPRLQPGSALLRIISTACVLACACTLLILVKYLAYGPASKMLPQTRDELLMGVLVVYLVLMFAAAVACAIRVIPAQPPLILDRLPLDKRGSLIAVSVRDHYVEVITTRGHQMVMIRFGEARRETGSIPGLRVHRYHWVARAHIAQVTVHGDTATLTMTDNTEIPVSRSGLKALQDAGLLPAHQPPHP
jgi:LytTr DNA-binding domain